MGGERAAAWFNYLKDEGFYPIIVTRCWNEGQSDVIGELDYNEYSFERVGNGEIHRVPIPRDLRNKIDGPIRKLLTLGRLLSRNTDAPVNEFKTMYDKCVDILKEDSEIKTVMASGRPFESFQIGYLLKKEFDITWIPDYRDEWNSHQEPTDQGWIWNKIKKEELKFEQTWTSNADHFLSVTSIWTERISKHIDKDGSTVMNGFELKGELQAKTRPGTKDNKVVITYAGTLYPTQEISAFLKGFKKIAKRYTDNIELNFLGTETVPEMNPIICKKLKNQLENVHFHKRMTKENLRHFIDGTDLLVLTSFPNVKGWLPVKLLDYFSHQKPILLCPGDDGEMEAFIQRSNSGFVVNSSNEVAELLERFIENKRQGTPLVVERKTENALIYTRKEQTKILAKLLNAFHS